ncbi:AcrR Transcriptional regulator [Flavobacteriaceae bacterium]|jgi:TetR/AcrR family transcriptional repressor of nem operon
MKSSEITKSKVLQEAITLFNTKGYRATSLSDITLATGLSKGAIYRHFENKEQLEIEAFQNMMHSIFQKLQNRIKTQANTRDKLFCVLELFQGYINEPFFSGGCPLLNVATEVDDTTMVLKDKALQALNVFRSSIETIVINGKTHKEVNAIVNEKLVAIVVISSLEGAIMMSKLQDSNTDIEAVVKHLKNWIVADVLL